VALREMRTTDAPSLFALLTAEEVGALHFAAPSSVEGFERFIKWAARQRIDGFLCLFLP